MDLNTQWVLYIIANKKRLLPQLCSLLPDVEIPHILPAFRPVVYLRALRSGARAYSGAIGLTLDPKGRIAQARILTPPDEIGPGPGLSGRPL